jgi:hypothetical protein
VRVSLKGIEDDMSGKGGAGIEPVEDEADDAVVTGMGEGSCKSVKSARAEKERATGGVAHTVRRVHREGT